jgi:hypothetical protein
MAMGAAQHFQLVSTFSHCFFSFCCLLLGKGIKGWVPAKRFQSMETFLDPDHIPEHHHDTQELPPIHSPTPTTSFKQPKHPTELKKIHSKMTPSELQCAVANELKTCNDLPEEVPLSQTIGKFKLMQPQPPHALDHPATPLLSDYADNGCPVECGTPWSNEHILLLLKRGPHQSALIPAAIEQLQNETEEKCKHGYARLVRWGDIKDNLPKNFKLSPLAMIPHKSKAYQAPQILRYGTL